MIPVIQANHCEILTIEGIRLRLSIITKKFHKSRGCSNTVIVHPGMIMAATTIIKKNRHPDKVEIRNVSAEIYAPMHRLTSKIVEAIE